jgi:hypothetical protein
MKESGVRREDPMHGVEEFLEVKSLCAGGIDLAGRGRGINFPGWLALPSR